MNEGHRILNEVAQGIRPLDDGAAWFAALPESARTAVLTDLAEFCLQARALTEDAPEAVRRAGIRPTHTPSVLLARGQFPAQLRRITALPRDEHLKAFRLLAALLTVAGTRRRTTHCANGCTHAWHHLNDQAVPGSGGA